jgi:acyl-CoA synthetase (AMP-forming)/AMP-acid ligase II
MLASIRLVVAGAEKLPNKILDDFKHKIGLDIYEGYGTTETAPVASSASIMSNVDIDEFNKFAALASRWWDKNSEFKPLQDINPLRLTYIKEKWGGSLKGKKILDVGCGGGILAESLALEGAIVTGIMENPPLPIVLFSFVAA